MKYLLIVFFGLMAVGAAGYGIYIAATQDLTTEEPPLSEPITVFPVAAPDTVQGGFMLVTTRDEDKVRVADVRKNPLEVQIDPDTGKPIYTLVSSRWVDGKGEGYGLAFDEGFGLFVVTVYEDSSGTQQILAERELLRRLEVSTKDFCRLQFYLTVVEADGSWSESTKPSLCNL